MTQRNSQGSRRLLGAIDATRCGDRSRLSIQTGSPIASGHKGRRSLATKPHGAGQSEKKKVVKYLFDRWKQGDLPDGIAFRQDVVDAIKQTGAKLSDGNAANFLKDLIRKKTVVQNWPDELIAAKISARQRYGKKRVFQFFEHDVRWPSPFPDWHAPCASTTVYSVQSVSMDSLARSLGRSEESSLTQIVVNLHLVHTQLALFSPLESRERVLDVRHLQMGVKTQPEIDAAFVATYRSESGGDHRNTFITLEAKQRDERILIDQIREQVSKAFEITKHLDDPPIDSVKPLALQVVSQEHEGVSENMFFLVEFSAIGREEFEANYRPINKDDERLYDMPLNECSATLYRLRPRISALG